MYSILLIIYPKLLILEPIGNIFARLFLFFYFFSGAFSAQVAPDIPLKTAHFLRLEAYNCNTTQELVICQFEKMFIS